LEGGAGKNAKLDVTTEIERNICMNILQAKAGNNYMGAAKPIARATCCKEARDARE
jgi:hypothetical protein